MELNNSNVKKIMQIIVFTVLLYLGIKNLNLIAYFISWLINLLFPFLLGAGIAFILNVPMRSIEKHLSKIKIKKKSISEKLSRAISLLTSIILVIGVIFMVVFLIAPELGRTFITISARLPAFFKNIESLSEELLLQYPVVADYISDLQVDWEQVGQNIITFLKNAGGPMIQSTFGIATSIVGGLINFFIGFIFAIYILVNKENLQRQVKKLIYAFINEKIADRIISICSLSNKTFSKFLSGQCLEAVILGTMFLIVMSIFRFPYALMISVLIAFTALIPVFGAFMGCVVGAFLILIVSPIKALWFIVLFLIIQQLENNLIYPYVVGNSIGLPGMWVLVAVTIGGSIFGVAGMLIFIPMTSVIYTLLRETINKRLKSRKITSDKL